MTQQEFGGYADGVEDADDFDPQENLTGDDPDEPYDTSYSPPDREPAGVKFGMTQWEESHGESLEQKLAEEEPDLCEDDAADDVADPRSGRLVAPDQGVNAACEERAIATDEGFAGYASSAEEAAMHTVTEDQIEEEVDQ